MAFFIPEQCDVEHRTATELMVFDALKQYLSNDWVVFHSYNYWQKDNENQIWDGEIDFLLYHERKGFLVIEVKGGDISYVNGEWIQDGKRISPVEQARRGKYAILRLLVSHHGSELSMKFAHAICFPSFGREAKIWPPEAEGLVITRDDLPNIERIAHRLLDDAPLPRGIGGFMEREEVLNVLSPEFSYYQDFQNRVLEDSRRFVKLTAQQEAIMEAFQNFPRLLIQGAAGTGKTFLAVKQAMSFVEQGKKVLLLCFNEMLAKKLKKQIGSYDRAITVGNFFDFVVAQAQIPNKEYNRHRNDPKLYTEVLPKLLGSFFAQHAQKFDAIIVDEGQDFTPWMWEMVSYFLAENGRYYVFYDPDQNIFCEKLSLPDFGLPPVQLTRNCRNTQKIFQALTPFRTVKSELMEESPIGCDVVEIPESTPEILARELANLTEKDRMSCGEVIVLGGHSLANTCVGATGIAGKFKLVEQPNTLGKNHIPFYTYMKFKGCEAKAVILLDVDEEDDRWKPAGLYTAMSRAVHRLVILRK